MINPTQLNNHYSANHWPPLFCQLLIVLSYCRSVQLCCHCTVGCVDYFYLLSSALVYILALAVNVAYISPEIVDRADQFPYQKAWKILQTTVSLVLSALLRWYFSIFVLFWFFVLFIVVVMFSCVSISEVIGWEGLLYCTIKRLAEDDRLLIAYSLLAGSLNHT